MEIFDLLDVENGNISELQKKYQMMLYIYQLGIIANNDEEEIRNIFLKKQEQLKRVGEEFFQDFKVEPLEVDDVNEILSSVYQVINLNNLNYSNIHLVNGLENLIISLPDCGEKYYLLAMLHINSLRNSNFTEEIVININVINGIINDLKKALSYDPSNELYQNYIDLVNEAIDAYTTQENERLRQVEREIERERQRQIQQHYNQKIKDTLGTIGVFCCPCCCCMSICGSIC